MDKVFVIAKREYLERVRSKWFFISTFLGPVLMLAVIILPNWLAIRSRSGEAAAHVIVLDATGTDLGRRVMAEVIGSPMNDTSLAVIRSVTPVALAEAESTATREVMAKKYEGYLVLDSGSIAGKSARYARLRRPSAVDRCTLAAACLGYDAFIACL